MRFLLHGVEICILENLLETVKGDNQRNIVNRGSKNEKKKVLFHVTFCRARKRNAQEDRVSLQVLTCMFLHSGRVIIIGVYQRPLLLCPIETKIRQCDDVNKGLLIDLSVPSRFSVPEHECLKIV